MYTYHSTETAVVLNQNDVIEAPGRRYGVSLVLFDMSTVFDTVEHEFLLSRLEQRFEMSCPVLTWMLPYLSDRSQSVNVPGGASSKSSVVCGVPQGSALGPLLFSMYTAPIGDIIRRHKLSFHLYVDDIQLCIKFEMTDETNRLLSLHRIEHCINNVRVWMAANLLKMNDDKRVARRTCVSITKQSSET